MSNKPKIPVDAETTARHIAKLKELCERWDKHIADLDVINERLEEQYQNSALGALHRRMAERKATKENASISQIEV